jgi:hypothetical protein
MRMLLARLAVCVTLCVAPRVASAEDAVAQVSWVTGAVAVQRAGQQAPEDVQKGAKLYRGDRIQAKNGADAGLIVGGVSRNLSTFVESRWVAGDPLDAPAKSLWQTLKEKAVGAEVSARPGGLDFASNARKEAIKKQLVEKGFLALMNGGGDGKGIANVLGGHDDAFAHVETGTGFGGMGVGGMGIRGSGIGGAGSGGSGSGGFGLNQKSGGGGYGKGQGRTLAGQRHQIREKIAAQEAEAAAEDAPTVTFHVPGATKKDPAQLTITSRGGAAVFTTRVTTERFTVPDGPLDPATAYRWKVKRGAKTPTGAFTSPAPGQASLVIEIPAHE